ncbi:ribonuclease kappa-like [Apostichopus japonicus]|uniref:ribonuclease kappa-like n=1 Tax=Stichopus japonicus TaxID=307972 RepID=UPI003AB52E34
MKTICGPKLSICCTLLSTWGLVMLLILGGLFRVNAVAFIEDVPATENNDELTKVYTNVSNNCFFAAGVYFLFLVFSGWQYTLGRSSHYQVN